MYLAKRIHMCRITAVIIAILSMSFFSACLSEKTNTQMKVITLHSAVLDKDIRIQVHLPKDYDERKEYPVLYYLPDYGGGAATVFDAYDAGNCADKLTTDGKIVPLIIVSTNMDQSFGINSSECVKRIETSTGKSFSEGPYEDYILNDLIPYIDSSYSTIANRSGRFIGGYSMGGFAALHVAFRHPDFFSKAGGHSPSLFIDQFPDKTVSDWLYPDDATRNERDPIRLAHSNDLTGLSVYIDTGETDVNIEGCAALFEVLKLKGIPVENHLFSGTHSRGYCFTYMSGYLTFYAGNDVRKQQ